MFGDIQILLVSWKQSLQLHTRLCQDAKEKDEVSDLLKMMFSF